MPSKSSQVQPVSYWRDAQDRISEAEIMCQAYGEHVIPIEGSVFFGKLTVSGKVGAFRYTAHYRDPNDWPAKGRVTKSLDQHDAIDLLCERAQVAAARAYVAEHPLAEVREFSAEARYTAERAAIDKPLHTYKERS